MAPLDPAAVAAHAFPEWATSWDADDVILYHLAVGAAAAPDALSYVYERDLVVLPSFGTLVAIAPILDLLGDAAVGVPLERLLHGEHRIEVPAPLPVAASIVTTARVTALEDKAPHAIVELTIESRDAGDGRLLFTNIYRGFLRDAGGFGGERGDRPPAAPDLAGVEAAPLRLPTTPDQALLYRLCGDKHPLHVDPEFARAAGFDRPILHGLCTFGIACRAVVTELLDGDHARVGAIGARFAGALFPGETLELTARRGDGAIAGAARCVQRDAPVLANLTIDLAEARAQRPA